MPPQRDRASSGRRRPEVAVPGPATASGREQGPEVPEFPVGPDADESPVVAIANRLPTQVVGPPGIGKSAMLHHVCWRDEPVRFGGVVFKEQRDEPVEDLLEFLFESFYESEPSFHPSPARLRRYLQDITALVVIDDLRLGQEDVDTLRNSAPACTFIAASDQVRLIDASLIALPGLPEDAGRALLERGMGRLGAPSEAAAIGSIVRTVAGNPRAILQAAALVATGRTDLAGLAERLAAGGAGRLAYEWVERLTPGERDVVFTLATLGDTPAPTNRVQAIAGRTDGDPILEVLDQRRLVEAHSPTYTLADNVRAAVQGDLDPAARGSTVVDHVVSWIRREGAVWSFDDIPLVVSAIGWAMEAGRWPEALELCRGVEGAVIAARQWGLWRVTLLHAVSAARQLNDPAALGWALHELGTRALCREEYGEAGELLRQALAARQAARDTEGARRTRENLRVLARLTSHGMGPWWKALLVLAAAALLGLAVLSQQLGARPAGTTTPTPGISVPITPTPTLSMSKTPTPTPSMSKTPTPTPSMSKTPTPTPLVSSTATLTARPSIASIRPDSGPAKGGTPVTIGGSGFLGATGATWTDLGTGQTTRTAVNVVSDSEITAISPSHPQTGGAAVVDVRVVSSGGTSNNEVRFIYLGTGPTPTPSVSPIPPR